MFEALMEAVKTHSLGQISNALSMWVGGQAEHVIKVPTILCVFRPIPFKRISRKNYGIAGSKEI